MNPKEITEMEAGREFDALVAVRVMGIVIVRENDLPVMRDSFHALGLRYVGGQRMAPPPFSTDIAAAWQVVEKMVGSGLSFDIAISRSSWIASFFAPVGDNPIPSPPMWEAMGTDAPLAICRAAWLVATEGGGILDG